MRDFEAVTILTLGFSSLSPMSPSALPSSSSSLDIFTEAGCYVCLLSCVANSILFLFYFFLKTKKLINYDEMSFYTTPNFAALESLNVPAFLPVPPLINIIAEWSALIPLVIHLASYRHTHQLAGQVALLGRVSIGIFPKLGVLTGISKLIESGPEFLDTASTLGKSGSQVWDIKWGSRFLSANGAASNILAEWILERGGHVSRIPEGIPSTILARAGTHVTESTVLRPPSPRTKAESTTSVNELCKLKTTGTTISGPSFRRYQTFHIMHFSKIEPIVSWRSRLDGFLQSPVYEALAFIFKLGIVIVLCLFGIYGTSATLLVGAVSQLVSRTITVQRPSGFLENNEVHDACMLVATHQNASTWYLFVGDRGIVDSLLNKTMVQIPPQKFAAWWFKQAHRIQLLAMTFAASQKGWDGVSLLILLIVSSIRKLRLKNCLLARMFSEANGIAIKQQSFEFSGRTCMLGAIQKVGGGASWAWMDDILVPCERRDVWAQGLSSADGGLSTFEEQMGNLSAFDRGWVLVNKQLSENASGIIMNAVNGLGTGRV